MSAAHPFSPRLIGGIAAAGIVAFAAFVLLLAFGGSLSSGRDGRPHALSNSAVGFSGLARLLDSRGDTRFIRHASGPQTEDLVVVAVEASTDPRQLSELLQRRSSRATLLILPKWRTLPDPARPGWVRYTGAGTPNPLALRGIRTGLSPRSAYTGRARAEGFLEGLSPAVPLYAQAIEGKGLRPLVTAPDGRMLVARWGNAPHYIVADPDLLNNHGIADAERARAAVRLVEELNTTGARAVHFDLTINGFGSAGGHNLLRLLFEPPFLVMTLALIAAAFLAGYHGLNRFGPARPEERAIVFGKAGLVENSAGLIRLAKREMRLGGAYVDVVRQEAARITAAPRSLQGNALDRYLDRFSAPGAPTFGDLAVRVMLARDRSDMVAAARALSRWKEELTR